MVRETSGETNRPYSENGAGHLSLGQPATDGPDIQPGIRPSASPTFRASPTSSANAPGLWLMSGTRLSSAAAPMFNSAASSCLEITDGRTSITVSPIVRRNADDAQSGRSPRRRRDRPFGAGENTNAIVRAARTRRSHPTEGGVRAPSRRTARLCPMQSRRVVYARGSVTPEGVTPARWPLRSNMGSPSRTVDREVLAPERVVASFELLPAAPSGALPRARPAGRA